MDNTSNNIISEIAPERLFRQLYDTSSTRKKQSLDRINKACKSQYNLKSKDFSIPTIANLIASEGGPSEQGLRNKNGSDYRLLINAWAEYSDGSIKKINQHKKTSNIDKENYEEILESISSSTARALFTIFVSEHERLKSELYTLKKSGETDLTVDMRKPKNIENQNDVLVSSTPNLTEEELEALKSAISEDFIKKQGWTITNGRVKQDGSTIYNRSYIEGIKKVLEMCNYNISE